MTRWRRTTSCERAAQWISLDLDGELGRLEQTALTRHLGRCEHCRQRSVEIQGFTGLLRAAPLLEPQRRFAVPRSTRATRRTTFRGAAIALVAAAAVFGGFSALPQSGTPVSALSFGGPKQQREFAREHVRIEPLPFGTEQGLSGSPFVARALL